MSNEIGTRIFYTGDMANREGVFVITANVDGWLTLSEVDGDRVFRSVPEMSIGRTYNGTCNPRFVPHAAVVAHRNERIASFRKAMSK